MKKWVILGVVVCLALLASCDIFRAFLGGASAGPSEPLPDPIEDTARQAGEAIEGLHPAIPFIAGILSGIFGDRAGGGKLVKALMPKKKGSDSA